MTPQEQKIIEALEHGIKAIEYSRQVAGMPDYAEKCSRDTESLQLVLEMFKRGPVGVVGPAYQLLWTQAYPTRHVAIRDQLYALPEKVK